MHEFKKPDIISSLVIGEIVAWFIVVVSKNLRISIPFVWAVPIVLPVLALIGLYIAYLISRKWSVIFQMAKFSLVGVSNVAIDFAVLNLLMWQTGIYKGKWIILLNACAFIVAVTNSYLWNKFWTFKAGNSDKAAVEFFQFFSVALVGAFINTGIVFGLTTFVPPCFGLSKELWANLAKVAATATALIWNFLGYKFFVFKK